MRLPQRCSGRWRRSRSRLRDQRGATLPELLVGLTVGSLILLGVTSIVFTSNGIQRAAADRSRISSSLAVTSLSVDRDAMMATATAPAKSQATSVACTTAIDLGFLEGGSSVRYRTVAAASDGPYWFQRVSGSATRTIARSVSACTWRAEADAGGHLTLRIDLTLTGATGETITQTLRGGPRLW